MADEPTSVPDEKIRLYSILADQIHKYNAILWQFPTAILGVNLVALNIFISHPKMLISVAIADFALAHTFFCLSDNQKAIIDATRKLEQKLREGPFRDFVPCFDDRGVKATCVIQCLLILLPICLIVFALLKSDIPRC